LGIGGEGKKKLMAQKVNSRIVKDLVQKGHKARMFGGGKKRRHSSGEGSEMGCRDRAWKSTPAEHFHEDQ